jgi:hypothetical protein
VNCVARLSLGAVALFVGMACFDTIYAASATVCDAYARNYARDASRQGQVLGRGAVGSLIGLGIGAATGGAAVGAAIGGGIGVISGGARRQNTAERMYQAAFQDCMAGRVR